MNAELRKIIAYVRNKNIIGAKHLPEDTALKRKIRHLPKDVQKEIYEGYDALIKKGYITRLKKRTGKGSDWHISITPEYVAEIDELLGEQDET